jgi:hypothetical protein
VDDRKINDLHEAALAYEDVKQQRMTLTPKEVAAKADVLRLMKKHKKKTYRCNGVEVDLVSEDETVKVRVKSAEADVD